MKILKSQSTIGFDRIEESEKFYNQYKQLEENEHFIAADTLDCLGEFLAIKIDDDCGAIIDARNRFVPFRVFKNCWSIGTRELSFASFDRDQIKQVALRIE